MKKELTEFLDAAPIGVHYYMVSSGGVILLAGANRAGETLFKLTHGSYEGRAMKDVLPALAETSLPDLIGRAAAGEKTQDSPPLHVRSGNARVAVVARAVRQGRRDVVVFFSPVDGNAGSDGVVRGTGPQAHKGRNAAEILQDSESFHRRVIENAAGVPFRLIFGPTLGSGRYDYVGTGIRQLLGLAPEEFTEERFNALVEAVVPLSPDIPVRPEECRRKMILGEIRRYQADLRIRTADGRHKWVNDSSLPLVDDKTGRVIGALGILMDITDRKEAHRELEDSEKRYRELVDFSPDAIAIHCDGKFVFINPAGVRLLGASSPAEVIGKPVLDIVHPDFQATVRERIARLTGDADHVQLLEEKFVRLDGRVVDVDVVAMPFTHAGKPAVQVIARDVSERKLAEALRTAVYEISQAADRASDLGGLFNAVHEIIGRVMPARNFYISLYDGERDIISFPYFVDEVDLPPSPVKPRKGLTEYVLRTGKPLLCDEATDLELRRRGEVEVIGAPSAIWLGVPLIVENKTIGVMVVQHYSDPLAYGEAELRMLQYVSSQVAKAIERRRSEDKLRESEEQFRLISENVADLIAVLDLDGRRLYNSPSYRGLFGDPASMKGTDSFEEIHPDDRERIRTIFTQTVQTGIGQRSEYRFLLPDGAVRFIESQGSVIKDEAGKVSKVVVVSRDVTDKKKLEEQFLRAQRMESIGTLASGIAHDLNNVLTPILMAIEVLRKKNPDADVQRILTNLQSTASRGSDIVRQVLAFGRGVQGERVLIQPAHIIDDIIKIARETFPKSIEIRTDIPKDLWTLSADPTQLHQVLLNVCVNARDAMPSGGLLTVSAQNTRLDESYARMHLEAHPGPYVLLTVSDTGGGIPPKVLDKIFEPFFTTKEIGRGTGLGLSTVLAIVKSHHGFINVYSEVGKGAAFKIYLPAEVDAKAAGRKESAEEIPLGQGELILVVDDESFIREVTKETLEANGYRVLTASDGTEAVAQYAQHMGEVDAVITDMVMPYMDGAATIRALQKLHGNVKILAVSGLTHSEQALAEAETATIKFLHKPYTSEKLLSSLRHLIEG